jgi:S1-C subfamily serine protease
MPRDARNPKYILTLAAVSASILIGGSLLKPDRQPREQPLLSETEMTRLQRLAQRQSLDNMADFFVQVAADVQVSVVRLPQAGRSAVIWGPDLVVTSGGEQRLAEQEIFWTADSRAVNAETSIASPSLPVAAVQTLDQAVLPVASRLPIEFIRPGKWILALWRRPTQEHAFAPANFLGTQEVRCWNTSYQEVVSTLALNDVMAGGGLFDLDGNLLGLIVQCDGRPAILGADSVQTALNQGVSFDGRMSTRYGVRVANLNEAERAYYKRKQGVVIRETWKGYRADQAGLLPGDLIVSLGEQPVDSVDDLEVLVLPLAREIFELGVVRGGRPLQVALRARPGSEEAGEENVPAGLRLSAPPEGYLIDSVMPASPAAQAGIQPGDRLLKIGHEDPRNLAAVRQALSRRQDAPLHVVLERGEMRWETILQ